VALGVFLLALRQSIPLARAIAGDPEYRADVRAEALTLVVSAVLLAGIARLGALFQAVKRAEQEVRQLLEAAPDAMVIADGTDRIADVNAAAVRLFGWRRDQLLGNDVAMLIPERFRERHRSRRAAYEEHPRPRVLGADDEVYGLRRDGTEFPAEINVSPLETAGGAFVVGSVRDITARRASERAVKESEQRFRSLLHDVLDTTPVGVCILDGDLRVVWVNHAYEGFFGVARRDVVGASGRQVLEDRVAPLAAEGDKFKERILATYENNTYREGFELKVRADGQERWLEHWSRPIETGLYRGGRIEHYTDVTERRLAEERIRLFMHICRNMQVGLLVYRMDDPADDRSLRVVTVNPEAEHLLGVSKEDLLGARIDDAFPALRSKAMPALFAEVLRSGEAREVKDLDYGDGRVARHTWSFKAFPLPDRCVGVVFEQLAPPE
jgi:PAS domain S-box-containing protein